MRRWVGGCRQSAQRFKRKDSSFTLTSSTKFACLRVSRLHKSVRATSLDFPRSVLGASRNSIISPCVAAIGDARITITRCQHSQIGRARASAEMPEKMRRARYSESVAENFAAQHPSLPYQLRPHAPLQENSNSNRTCERAIQPRHHL